MNAVREMTMHTKTDEDARVGPSVPQIAPAGSTASRPEVVPALMTGPAGHSASIARLACALAKAQSEMTGASKDSLNPHFKSKYADLAAIWDACRGPLSRHELAVVQLPSAIGSIVTVTTLLVHSSGEYIGEALTLTATQDTPQGVGSAITYGRRYGLASLVGIAPEDDDGNAASGRGNGHSQPAGNGTTRPPATAPAGFEAWRLDLQAVADEGSDKLKAAWEDSPVVFRSWLTLKHADSWMALKARAVKAGAR